VFNSITCTDMLQWRRFLKIFISKQKKIINYQKPMFLVKLKPRAPTRNHR
jgi:hypothetical protein